MVSGNIDLLSLTRLSLFIFRVIATRHFAQTIFDKLNGAFVFDDKVSQHQIRLLTSPAPDILKMTDRKLFPVLGIDQPDVPVFILRMQDRDAHPFEGGKRGRMEYLLRRARYDYLTELVRLEVWQISSAVKLLTRSTYRHVSTQQRAVSQLIAGFPSRVLKKYFMFYLRFRRDKNEGWGRRFLYNSGSSGARQRDRSCRQALGSSPFDKLPFHLPMRMPDVAIFGCTPDITIRAD